jgi:uncharacterized protein YjbI with pentapeptide repeats
MANPKHLDILKEGVGAWNRWRERNPDIRPDLSSTSLSRQDLRGVDFRHCSLAEAHLNNADLGSVDLTRA